MESTWPIGELVGGTRVRGWVSEWMGKRVSEWVGKRVSEWTGKRVSEGGRMGERVGE